MHPLSYNACRAHLLARAHLLIALIDVWPTSGTKSKALRDQGQSQQIQDCPGDSETVGAYGNDNSTISNVMILHHMQY